MQLCGGIKVCRYNLHSAGGSLGWLSPVLKYKCVFQMNYTEAISSNSTRKLLWFETTKMLIAVLKSQFILLFVIIFGTFSFPTMSEHLPSSEKNAAVGIPLAVRVYSYRSGFI